MQNDILAIGELLIDFTPMRSDDSHTMLFEQNPGGAPPNVLAMVSNLGGKAAFIGKVGEDKFGHYLVNVLNMHDINTKGIVYDRDVTTTLAFIHLEEFGERSFSFCRNPGADILLEENEVNIELINDCRLLHFGSLSFTNEPSKSAVLNAIKYAKRNGKIISYDPNYRPVLWNSEQAARDGMKIGIEYADIIKVSKEEAYLITGKNTIEAAGRELLSMGIKLVLISLGEAGSYYINKQGNCFVNGYMVKPVDTTGAGDAFMGSMLYQLLQLQQKVENIETTTMSKMLRYANACAALCVQRRGGIPAMPSVSDINEFMEREVL